MTSTGRDKESASDPQGTTPVAPGDDAAPGSPGTGENLCPECNGSGRISSKRCPNCNGTGKVTEGIGGA